MSIAEISNEDEQCGQKNRILEASDTLIFRGLEQTFLHLGQGLDVTLYVLWDFALYTYGPKQNVCFNVTTSLIF